MVPTGKRSGGPGLAAGVGLGAADVRPGAAARSGAAERAGAVPLMTQAVSPPAASKAATLTASAVTCECRPPDERR